MRYRHIVALALWMGTAGCADPPPPAELTGEVDDAIVGGAPDAGHHYTIGVGDDFQPWCSATLISSRTVLTAGHCALGITRVYFGSQLEHSASADIESSHPLWNDDLNTPDLAVVRLAEPVTMQPAPLLRDTLENTPEFIGPLWTWSGFGVDDPINQSGFGTRRVTTIAVNAIGPFDLGGGFILPETYIHYETSGSSPCFGDSGGPAYFTALGTEHVTAVASWVGDDFCSTFGAHARIDQPMITSWLQGMIDSFESGNPCKSDGACDETCNTGGEVRDPDCHSAHCGADGICALACVAPADPDCANYVVDFCQEDGICATGCSPPDMDCDGAVVAATTSPATTVTTTQSTAATTVGPTVTSASTTTTGSSMTGGGSPGTGGSPPRAPGNTGANDDTMLYGRSCAHAPRSRDEGIAWLSVLGLFAFGLRRRPR